MDEEYIDLNLEVSDDRNKNIITNPLELFLQEIELLMQLAPTDIWGVNEGIDLKRYIFNKYVTLTQIKNEIKTYIGKHCQHAQYFQYNVSAEMINVENKELLYIVMRINSGQDIVNKKFLLG